MPVKAITKFSYIYRMSTLYRNTIKASIIIAMYSLTAGCHSRGLSLDDMENTDAQKNFKAKLILQQQAIDSMAKIYKGKKVVVTTFNDFNGEPRKIGLYATPGYRKLATLTPGDTVQILDVLHKYQFNETPVPRILTETNVKVKTKNGTIGMMAYRYIHVFKEELKEKQLETDTL